MACDNLGEEQWKAARLAVGGAFFDWPTFVEELEEILKFLDYHVGLQGGGVDHGSYIGYASRAILLLQERQWTDPLSFECFRDFNWASPSFVRGLRSMVKPRNTTTVKVSAIGLIAFALDGWFNKPVPVMEQEEMLEFCKNVAEFVSNGQSDTKRGVTILFGMLRCKEWRKCIDTRFWSVLAHCPLVEELESVRWCLQNATMLLDFAKGLPDQGEGLKWWCWTLWFHYEKIDTMARGEVKKIAKEMMRDDRRSDLSLYLKLIKEEISRIRKELSGEYKLSSEIRDIKARIFVLEGNYDKLARIREGGR